MNRLPQGVIPLIWGYEADSPFSQQSARVAQAGFADSYYVAPGAGTWNSFGGRLDVARANIQNAATAGQLNRARGLLLTAWGDNGHHQPTPTLFPPLILAAQAAWGAELADASTLAETIDTLFYPAEPAGSGQALCALARIDGMLPQPAPPSSFLHRAFFCAEDELETLLQLTTQAQLHATLEELNGICTHRIDPEIQLGIDLNRQALERCLGMDFTDTRAALTQRFRAQWLRHSRAGGLEESLGYF